MKSLVKAIMNPFVMRPSLEMALTIGNQMPMPSAFRGNGRFIWVSILNASIRISRTLFRKANNGPSGNATVNSVKNPN